MRGFKKSFSTVYNYKILTLEQGTGSLSAKALDLKTTSELSTFNYSRFLSPYKNANPEDVSE